MLDIDRNLPVVDVTTMEEQISKTLRRERMFATLCNSFGLFALVLSVVGLYGVMAYDTSRRHGEIGVRLALGAMPKDVLLMVLREGLLLAGLGTLIGVPVVWLGGKYVEKRAFPDGAAGACLSFGGAGHPAHCGTRRDCDSGHSGVCSPAQQCVATGIDD